MKEQFDILVWRLESDFHLIERYYREVGTQYPSEVTRIYFLDAKLKFLGHALEVINHARFFHLFYPSRTQEEIVQRARQDLIDLVGTLASEDVGQFAGDGRLVNLLLGDACHAYHALSIGHEV